MDLDLRKLRYFVTLADELHFGRAAQRLFIAQPVLSRQIRALEREVGVTLLDRTSRRVGLTPAGAQLHDDARNLLASAAGVTRRAHEAARGLERVVVGFAPGLRVAPAVAAFGTIAPGVAVELLELVWYEGADAVRDGRVDVAVVRDPADTDGLVTRELGTEPKVAVIPAGHRLAAKRHVRLADLDGEMLVEIDRRCTSIEAKLELAASGRDIATVPRSVAKIYARPGLVSRRIVDREPQRILLVMPEGPRPRVREFFDLASKVLPDQPGRA
jgi:DNA-binding transcriptional LysR family regulator